MAPMVGNTVGTNGIPTDKVTDFRAIAAQKYLHRLLCGWCSALAMHRVCKGTICNTVYGQGFGVQGCGFGRDLRANAFLDQACDCCRESCILLGSALGFVLQV